MGKTKKSLEERFWEKVDKRGPDECWNWKAYQNAEGYGHLNLGNNLIIRSHRYSFILHKGPIPENELIRHSCHNTSCVNPDHLSSGSNWDNAQDKVRAGRSSRMLGGKNPRTKLSEKDVLNIRAEYQANNTSYSKLAIKYQVCKSNIVAIVKRLSWKHL